MLWLYFAHYDTIGIILKQRDQKRQKKTPWLVKSRAYRVDVLDRARTDDLLGHNQTL